MERAISADELSDAGGVAPARSASARATDDARHRGALLIRGATLRDGRGVDLRIERDRAGVGRIMAMGEALPPDGARVLAAQGGLLLPGLHDHHLHLAATAAARASIRCGPPEVTDAAGLASALRRPGTGWLRGIGYHESVGMIDRRWLDDVVPERPVRVQHRSGRMWVLNSAALDALLAHGGAPPPGLDPVRGRLFDEDGWLRRAMRAAPPSLREVGAELARYGVTGVTDMSPTNDAAAAGHVAHERASGALPQRLVLAGRPELGDAPLPAGIALGPVKLHLHEAQLPDFATTVAGIRAAHDSARPVAVHCVTEVELIFTLAALRDAGSMRGDRIEHASVASDELVAQVAELGLTVVAQPNFVAERGDAYREAIPQETWPHLYRLRAFADAGVVLAGGTDAPFGRPDPWAAMAAAVTRRTTGGARLTPAEALSPEAALALFLADPQDLAWQRELTIGAPADLCLLDRPWRVLRTTLSAAAVRATFIDGRIVHDGDTSASEPASD